MRGIREAASGGCYATPFDGVQRVLQRDPVPFEAFVHAAAASGVWGLTPGRRHFRRSIRRTCRTLAARRAEWIRAAFASADSNVAAAASSSLAWR